MKDCTQQAEKPNVDYPCSSAVRPPPPCCSNGIPFRVDSPSRCQNSTSLGCGSTVVGWRSSPVLDISRATCSLAEINKGRYRPNQLSAIDRSRTAPPSAGVSGSSRDPVSVQRPRVGTLTEAVFFVKRNPLIRLLVNVVTAPGSSTVSAVTLQVQEGGQERHTPCSPPRRPCLATRLFGASAPLATCAGNPARASGQGQVRIRMLRNLAHLEICSPSTASQMAILVGGNS